MDDSSELVPLGAVSGTEDEDPIRFLEQCGHILSASSDYEASMDALGRLVVQTLADWYVVDVRGEDGLVRTVAVAHVDPAKEDLARELQGRWPPSLDGRPSDVPAVIATGRSEWFRVISEASLEEAAGGDQDLVNTLQTLGLGSSMTVPLAVGGRVLGTITLARGRAGRAYEERDVRLVEEVARRAALTIDHALLLREERRARERLVTVSQVSELLAESIEYSGTFVRLAELVVRDFADICLIDVVGADGAIVRQEAVHADPALQPLADRLREEFAPSPAGPHPVARVIATGEPEFAAEMPQDFLRSTTRDSEHFQLVTDLGFQSFMCVPLQARGATLGALTIVSTNPGRRYGPADLGLAVEIARRAALHIDNTRLYDAQSRAARQAARLAAIVDAAFTSESLEDLLSELLLRVTSQLGTQLAGLLLTEEDEPVLRMRAAIGLEEDVMAEVRVPIGRGFAGRIAATRKPLVIEDIPRFGPVSSYLRERVSSSVGVPLMLGSEVVGVLHTSSVTPRTFDADDVALLQLAAERAAVAIRRTELYERQQEMSSMLQEALLPSELPDIPGVELATLFEAAGRGVEVGGDFYDVWPMDATTWGVTVGDVCGRGSQAAAVTALARNAIRALAMEERRPSRVLAGLNRLMRQSGVDRFCTAIHATLTVDPTGAHLALARGGHEPPLVLRSDGSVQELGGGGPLLGVFDAPLFTQEELSLGPGDALVMFTDGLVERNPVLDGGLDLRDLLRQLAGLSAEEIKDRLSMALCSPGAARRDDVVVLVVRVVPS